MSRKSNAVKNEVAVSDQTTNVETVGVEMIESNVSAETTFDGEAYIKELGGVSKAIRELTRLGHSRGVVAKMLNKRYQHVRNVLITPIKKEVVVEQINESTES